MADLGEGGIKETKLVDNLIEVGIGILERNLIRPEEVEILHKNVETLCDLMIDIHGISEKDHKSVANVWRYAYKTYLDSLIPVLEELRKKPGIVYSLVELTTKEFAKYF